MTNFTIDMEKQLSKLGKEFQDLVERISPRESAHHDFHPAADVTESSDLFKIELDVPGMDKTQLHITLQNRVVTISGERKMDLGEGENSARSERKQGAFSRSFALPETADPRSLKAASVHGVLTITAEKRVGESKTNGTSIPID